MAPILILSILSPLLPLAAGVKKRFSLIWSYCLVALLFDTTGTLLKRVFHVNHLWVGNIFLLVEFVLLSLLFRRIVPVRRTVFYIWIAFVSAIYLLLSRHTFWTFNLTSASIFSFLYILYSLAGYHSIVKEKETLFVERFWFFWLCSAIAIYASGSFLLFLFRNYMITKDPSLYLELWSLLFLSLNILKNLLLSIAIFYYPLRKNE
jgi:hypothetical protein